MRIRDIDFDKGLGMGSKQLSLKRDRDRELEGTKKISRDTALPIVFDNRTKGFFTL